jgi:hypothetical protein
MNAAPSASLLTRIYDIKGLDPISWWPLAPAWWLLLAIVSAGLAAWGFVYLRRRAYHRSWKGDANRRLTLIASRLGSYPAQEIASDLSTTLRRVAIQRFSRGECAGLEGQEWIAWLQDHDPFGFPWKTHASLLTELPYAPPNSKIAPEEVRVLIQAARRWVS